jgi:RNA polymerase sigma-70 factor (ECF subfamily)
VQLQAFDSAYVDRLRAGDAETERHFVAYFSELLDIKLRWRLPSRSLVEEARQETFLRVLRAVRSPGGVREPERIGAFVNAVCNNVLFELYRARGRDRLSDDDMPPLADASRDPEARVITEERQATVRQILERMPARDRRLLRAVFLEERDKDEVCAQLGVDRDYLRVLLHRAKNQFRLLYLSREPAPARGRLAVRERLRARGMEL